jgi:hypothetical protein
MRFLVGYSRLAADERITCRRDGRRKDGSPREIALRGKAPSFYWLALGLTAGFIVAAAILGTLAAQGAKSSPAQVDLLSDVAQASERDEPLVREEVELEVLNASAV